MTQEQIDEALKSLADWEKEVKKHNQDIIKSIGDVRENFNELVDFCYIRDKIEWCEEPTFKAEYNPYVYGVFTLTHVDQWSVGMDGDSFEGFMYAKVQGKNKWLKIPYSC